MIYLGSRCSSGQVIHFTVSFLLFVLPVAFGGRLEEIKTQIQTVKNEHIFVEKVNQRLQQLYENTKQNVGVELKNIAGLVGIMDLDKRVIEELMTALKTSYDEQAALLEEVGILKNNREVLKFQIALEQHDFNHFQDKRAQGFHAICKALQQRTNIAARSLGRYMRNVQNNAIIMGQEILLERMQTTLNFTLATQQHLIQQIENYDNVLLQMKEEVKCFKQHMKNTQDVVNQNSKALENTKTNIKNLKCELMTLNGENFVMLNALKALRARVTDYNADKKCYSQMLRIEA